MSFSVTVLGCSSATPAHDRYLSAHLLNAGGRFFLIDCGEGTQFQLKKYKLSMQRIRHIFISHMHGDHYFGLIGLLNSMHLHGRKHDLHLYAPPALKDILDAQFEASLTVLAFPLHFHLLSADSCRLIFDDEMLTVHSFPLLHSVPSCGFLFREKQPPRKIRKEILTRIDIPVEAIKEIKAGNDYIDPDGTLFPNASITLDPPGPSSYAYCSDTGYSERIIPWIHQVNVLYHEATFMQDMADLAREKLHSTARDAASIAVKSKVGKLILGHFSARYEDLQPLLREAREIFPESYLAEEGARWDL
jgi:ribonuclease Z